MKHYRILSFQVQRGIEIHRYNIIDSSGSYLCTTLNNDKKIESDFICESNSHIHSITIPNYPNRTFSIGTLTNMGTVSAIKLKNGEGVVRMQTQIEWLPIRSISVVQPTVITNNTEMKKATISKTATPPSRSQLKEQQNEELEKLQEKILKETPIRLANFYKRDLPDTLEEFLIKFFQVYNTKHKTIYVQAKREQTEIGKRRSIGDLFLISRYYYPECTLKELLTILYINLPKTLKTGFRSSFCSTIKKQVWYYSEGNGNLIRDNSQIDEYKNIKQWYLDRL